MVRQPANINPMVDQNHYTAESFATNSLSTVDKYMKCYDKKKQIAQKISFFTLFGSGMQVLLQRHDKKYT